MTSLTAIDLVYPVERYGAVGDGTTDDRQAIQDAIDAATANGGGTVSLMKSGVHAWSGQIMVKNGVILQGHSTRQMLTGTTMPGLLALDGTARLDIGNWATIGAGKPGGASNLYVDGAGVGGAGTTDFTELVRIAGVNIYIENLFVVNGVADGIVYDGVQNSTVVGGYAIGFEGTALAIDNGCGNVSFHGGYYGQADRVLHIRDTASQANAYFFGSASNSWYNTIFERYPREGKTEHAIITIDCGQHNVFHNCNFTNGSPVVSDDCLVLINNSVYFPIPTMVEFDAVNCYAGPKPDATQTPPIDELADVFRIVGNNMVAFTGDGFINYGKNLICQDSGSAYVMAQGDFSYVAPTTNFRRAINSGYYSNWYTRHRITQRIETPSGYTAAEFRIDGDTYPRGYIGPDMTLGWQNGTGTATLANLVHDGAGTLNLGGRLKHTGGLIRFPGAQFVNTATFAATLDTKLYYEHNIVFTATGTHVTSLTLSNAVEGAEIRIGIFGNGTNSITWPSTVRFANGTTPPIASNRFTSITLVYAGAKWLEVARTQNVTYT